MWSKTLLALGLALTVSAGAFAAVSEKTEEGSHYKLVYPVVSLENKSAAKKINKDIKEIVTDTKKLLKSKHPTYVDVGTHYELIGETDDYINLIMVSWDYMGGAHGMHRDYGIVYDKATGERLPYTHFTNEVTAAELFDGIKSKRYPVYCGDRKTSSEAPFVSYIKKEDFKVSDYYILQNGKVYLMYPPYELDCYAAGTTYVELK